MKIKILWMAALMLVIGACGNRSESPFTTVDVEEVIEVESYTYLLVHSKKEQFWIAVPAMEANPGETYHYQGGMSMVDFYSKELDRTFEEVLFVEALFPGKAGSDPGAEAQAEDPFAAMEGMEGHGATAGSSVVQERSDVNLEPVEGILSIAKLFENAAQYEGKLIRVRGEVAKYNPAIMERNWVHIQDGSEYEGKFDLTVTSEESFTVGEVVTVEGVLALDLDFGYGYTYEILLEKAKAVR